MSWLRERVESKTGRTVPLPPRNQPWLPSVLVQVAPAVVSALTYAVIDERDQPRRPTVRCAVGLAALGRLETGATSAQSVGRGCGPVG